MIRLRRFGKVQMLVQVVEEYFLYGGIGIVYICWVIYGEFLEVNVYLYVFEYIVVVYNGIIENYELLCEELKVCGYIFVFEIDIEVIVYLVNWELK